MKLTDIFFLLLLGAIWGSSFIFMRATVDVFGPIALIAVRSGVAALCLLPFLLMKERRQEFIKHWKSLAWIGVISSALPFCFLAYASIDLTGGTVSILNAMTPVFTAWIAHLWLKDKMTTLQFLGLLISILGLSILVWDKVSWDMNTWWPILAGVLATLCYGVASNSMKQYLSEVSTVTKTAGTLFFAALFMFLLLPFFMPDTSAISRVDWLYAIILGILCTAIAYALLFVLIKNIGPMRASSVTFIIPVFSFLWGYLLLGEVVTSRMWGAIAVILLGMALVLKLLQFGKAKT